MENYLYYHSTNFLKKFPLPGKLLTHVPGHLTPFWPLLTSHFRKWTFSFLYERTFSHRHYFLFLNPPLFFLTALILTWHRCISCLWCLPRFDISSIKTKYLSVLIHGCSAVLAQYLAFVEQMNGFPPFLCVQRKFLPKGSLYKAWGIIYFIKLVQYHMNLLEFLMNISTNKCLNT